MDDGSTPTLEPVAAEYGVRYMRVDDNGGDRAARNKGAGAADGDILLFLDADIAVHTDTLARLLETFRSRPDLAAVFGSYDETPTAPGVVSRYRNLLHHYTHQQANPDASTFWTGCGAVRRHVFEELGGFDERPGHEMADVDFGYRLRDAGHRIFLDKQLQVTHLKRWTLFLMVKTDLLLRAIPWSRQILRRRSVPADLNIGASQKAAVALTGMALLSLLLSCFDYAFLGVSIASVAAVVALTKGLLALIRRLHGTVFAIACVPLHLIHLATGGLGYVIAWSETLLSARHSDG